MICSDPLVRDWIDPDPLPDLQILILLIVMPVLSLLWKTLTVAAWKQSRPINRNIGDRLLLLEQICRNAAQIPYKSEELSDTQCSLRAGWTRDTWGQGCYKQCHCVIPLAGCITGGVSYAAMELWLAVEVCSMKMVIYDGMHFQPIAFSQKLLLMEDIYFQL